MTPILVLLMACGGSAELNQPNPPPVWPLENTLKAPDPPPVPAPADLAEKDGDENAAGEADGADPPKEVDKGPDEENGAGGAPETETPSAAPASPPEPAEVDEPDAPTPSED